MKRKSNARWTQGGDRRKTEWINRYDYARFNIDNLKLAMKICQDLKNKLHIKLVNENEQFRALQKELTLIRNTSTRLEELNTTLTNVKNWRDKLKGIQKTIKNNRSKGRLEIPLDRPFNKIFNNNGEEVKMLDGITKKEQLKNVAKELENMERLLKAFAKDKDNLKKIIRKTNGNKGLEYTVSIRLRIGSKRKIIQKLISENNALQFKIDKIKHDTKKLETMAANAAQNLGLPGPGFVPEYAHEIQGHTLAPEEFLGREPSVHLSDVDADQDIFNDLETISQSSSPSAQTFAGHLDYKDDLKRLSGITERTEEEYSTHGSSSSCGSDFGAKHISPIPYKPRGVEENPYSELESNKDRNERTQVNPYIIRIGNAIPGHNNRMQKAESVGHVRMQRGFLNLKEAKKENSRGGRW